MANCRAAPSLTVRRASFTASSASGSSSSGWLARKSRSSAYVSAAAHPRGIEQARVDGQPGWRRLPGFVRPGAVEGCGILGVVTPGLLVYRRGEVALTWCVLKGLGQPAGHFRVPDLGGLGPGRQQERGGNGGDLGQRFLPRGLAAFRRSSLTVLAAEVGQRGGEVGDEGGIVAGLLPA
jgi:hypothetical protein